MAVEGKGSVDPLSTAGWAWGWSLPSAWESMGIRADRVSMERRGNVTLLHLKGLGRYILVQCVSNLVDGYARVFARWWRVRGNCMAS